MNNSKSLYPSLEEFMVQEQIDLNYYKVDSKVDSKVVESESTDSSSELVLQKVENKLVLANPEVYSKSKRNEGIYQIKFRKNQGLKLTFQVYKGGVFISDLNQNGIDLGLHLADQLINLNGLSLSGLKKEKVDEYYNRFDNAQLLTFIVRDRPYSKVITLTKSPDDKTLGFLIKRGYVNNLIENTSAHRNGLLIDHRIVEVNGNPIYHLSDQELITRINDTEFISVHLTIYPRDFYEKLIKKSWW